MKRILTAFIATVSMFTAQAQKSAPDNDFVLNTILDGTSTYYYQSIFPRYMAGDTTLTQSQYYYLYYGYAFQESYKPLEVIPAQDAMLTLLGKGGTMTHEDHLKTIEYANEIMQADPFNPMNINFMTYIYTLMGDESNAKVSADRFNKIIGAIESSGSGTDEKSPWHVLWSSHGKSMLMARGLLVQRTYIVSKDVEYVMLHQRDAGGNKGYYFDYSRMYMNRPAGSGKRVEGLELNGIKIKNSK